MDLGCLPLHRKPTGVCLAHFIIFSISSLVNQQTQIWPLLKTPTWWHQWSWSLQQIRDSSKTNWPDCSHLALKTFWIQWITSIRNSADIDHLRCRRRLASTTTYPTYQSNIHCSIMDMTLVFLQFTQSIFWVSSSRSITWTSKASSSSQKTVYATILTPSTSSNQVRFKLIFIAF